MNRFPSGVTFMTSSQIKACHFMSGFGLVAANWEENLLAIVESQDMAALEIQLMPYQPELLRLENTTVSSSGCALRRWPFA